MRQPLPALTIIHPDPALPASFGPLLDVIREELNVKEIWFAANEADFVHLEARPNLKVLGPRLGKKMKAVAAAIVSLPQDDLRRLSAGGTVELEGETLDASCLLIARNAREGQVVAAG